MKVRLTVTTDGPSLGTVRAEGPGLRLTTGIGVRAGGVAVPASVLPPLVARNWRLSASGYLSPPPRRRKKLSTTPTMTTSTMTVSSPRAMVMLR